MRPAIAFSVAVTAVMLAGCAAKPPLVTECLRQGHAGRPGPALVGLKYGTQATPIPLDSVQFSDWGAEKTVSVQDLHASRTATNTVEVTARFISCSDVATSIRVRTSFLGANQAPTEPASAWQTVYLEPHLTATYTENSVSTGVSDYLIEIMPGS
jgi:hypothetical protein